MRTYNHAGLPVAHNTAAIPHPGRTCTVGAAGLRHDTCYRADNSWRHTRGLAHTHRHISIAFTDARRLSSGHMAPLDLYALTRRTRRSRGTCKLRRRDTAVSGRFSDTTQRQRWPAPSRATALALLLGWRAPFNLMVAGSTLLDRLSFARLRLPGSRRTRDIYVCGSTYLVAASLHHTGAGSRWTRVSARCPLAPQPRAWFIMQHGCAHHLYTLSAFGSRLDLAGCFALFCTTPVARLSLCRFAGWSARFITRLASAYCGYGNLRFGC